MEINDRFNEVEDKYYGKEHGMEHEEKKDKKNKILLIRDTRW